MPAFSEMPWGTILGHIQTGTCLNVVSSGVFGFGGRCFFCVCFIVIRTPLCRYKGQLYDLDKCSDLLLACKYCRKAEAWDQCR